MYAEFTRAWYRGSVNRDPLVADSFSNIFSDSLFCIKLPNQGCLILDQQTTVPVLKIYTYRSTLSKTATPDEILPDVPVFNYKHCPVTTDKAACVSITHFSRIEFTRVYPRVHSPARFNIKGVIRISFNDHSLFFDLNSNQERNFKIAFGYQKFQRWIPMVFKKCTKPDTARVSLILEAPVLPEWSLNLLCFEMIEPEFVM